MDTKYIAYGFRSLLLVALVATGVTMALGQTPRPLCTKGVCTYNIAAGTYKGDMQRGPGTVLAYGLNTIRYRYEFNNVTTYQAAPDLWTGLGQMSTTTPATPAPAPEKPQREAPAPQNVATMQGNRHSLAAPHPAPDPFNAVDTIIQESSALRASTQPILDKFFDQQGLFNAPITTLGDLNAQLLGLQTQANNSIAKVAAGGASLKSYLATSPDDSAGLVAVTQGELINTTFTDGINADWPILGIVTALQSNLLSNANDLNNVKQRFDGYSPGESATLKAAEADLTVVQSKLTAAEATYEKGANPDPIKVGLAKAELSKLAAEIGFVQADEALLAAFPAQIALAIAQNGTAVTGANGLAPASTNYTNFVAARQALAAWRDQMASKVSQFQAYANHTPGAHNPFMLANPVGCGFAFSRTKDDAVTLTRVDMTPGLANPAPETVLSTTVECTSPFSLAAGVVFSTIPNHEFAIQATPTTAGNAALPKAADITTQNTIVETATSKFHPLTLAAIHTRLYEPTERFAIYASFGAAANVRSQSAGGSTAEYLVGPSIGLWRTAFITLGAHFGSEAKVGSGYSIGSPVPSTVTTVPLQTNYKVGFGLGISFTKP